MLDGWRRLPEIAQTARSRRQNITGDDQITLRIDRNSAITNKLYLRDQARPLEKHLFVLGRRHYDAIAHCFFLLSLATAFILTYENHLSTTLTPPKNRGIYIKEVFCRISLCQNHRYHKLQNILFIFLNMKSGIRITAPQCMKRSSRVRQLAALHSSLYTSLASGYWRRLKKIIAGSPECSILVFLQRPATERRQNGNNLAWFKDEFEEGGSSRYELLSWIHHCRTCHLHKNPVVYMDNEKNIRVHIWKIYSVCYFHIRRLR